MNHLGDTLRANDAAARAKFSNPALLARYEERRQRNLVLAEQFFEQARARFVAAIESGATSDKLGIRVCKSHRIWSVYGFDSGLVSFGCAAKVGDYYAPWRDFCAWARDRGLQAYWQSVSNPDTGARHYVLSVQPMTM